jgi:concentrative nucleoside transporter, CNT family
VVASVSGAPAATPISRIMVPEKPGAATGGEFKELAPVATSTMDAIVLGTMAGLELLLNICAMLIVLIALVHLVDAMLGALPAIGGAPVTLERGLGIVMAPICWLMGVPWQEATTAGALMGVKTILNEFVAYLQLAALPPDALSERSRLIMVYAMCGFANFGSLGIMIGGLTTMAPERREDIVSLGAKSIVSGTLSTCLLGAIVGALT